MPNVNVNQNSNTKKLVGTAVFATLAFVVSLLEFPIFPVIGYIKLDFSLVFILFAGFAFGFVYGISACVCKELLRFLFVNNSGGVGEIANVIISVGFIVIPTIVYHYKKGLPIVVLTLVLGGIIECILGVLANKFIFFPLFGLTKEEFNAVWVYILLFNIIKVIATSGLTILLYKRVSYLIKKL